MMNNEWVTVRIPNDMYKSIQTYQSSPEEPLWSEKNSNFLISQLKVYFEDSLMNNETKMKKGSFIVPTIPKAILIEKDIDNEQENSSSLYAVDVKNRCPLQGLFQYFHWIGSLKKVKRTGWLLEDIQASHTESIAEHMYRMSMMALAISPESVGSLDLTKCIKMALVHDVAEAIVGDIPPSANIMKNVKHEWECKAMTQFRSLLSLHNDVEFYGLWSEYEEQITPEAIFVKDLDRMEMLLQAFEYEIEFPHLILDEWFNTSRDLLKTELAQGWMVQLDYYRQATKNSKSL